MKIREFLTFFKIRKNSLSGRGSAVRFLFGLLIIDCGLHYEMQLQQPLSFRVVFEHWPLDLTQINNRLALFLCL